MSKQLNLKYIFILIISSLALFCSSSIYAQDDAPDTVAVIKDTVKPKVLKKDNSGRHLSLSIDLYHPVLNHYISNKEGYEFSIDYYLHHDLYLALEGGFGGSNVTYTDLQYTTKNNFYRAGFNRSLLIRYDSTDWDNMFIGFRLGAADIHRSAASYIVTDSLWGNSSGMTSAKDFPAFWVELLLGVRVQIIKRVSLGWNFRGKFMLNSKSFKDLAPLYISGFGRGDKNSAFDFDFYLTYGISWKRKSQILPPPVVDRQ